MNDVIQKGPAPESAPAALILIHGRGATAAGMMDLYAALNRPDIAAVAPQAPGGTWYPHSFMAPFADNQPHLDHALQRIDDLVNDLLDRGLASGQIALLGFSQGACLTSEYTLRHPRRYGAIMILTGGYIGPPGIEHSDTGTFDGTPVFIGVNDPDPHVPFERAQDTADRYKRMGAAVELRRYPDMPHTVNDDEIAACRKLLERIVTAKATEA